MNFQKMLAVGLLAAASLLTSLSMEAKELIWETTVVEINDIPFKVRIADSYRKRTKGLMGVEHLPKDEGMLFVFDRPGAYCVWMNNTLIPLTVIFLDEQGAYIDHLDLTPRDLTHRCTSGKAKYAIEINQGILPGSQL